MVPRIEHIENFKSLQGAGEVRSQGLLQAKGIRSDATATSDIEKVNASKPRAGRKLCVDDAPVVRPIWSVSGSLNGRVWVAGVIIGRDC